MRLKYKLLLFIILVGSIFAVTVYAISKRIINTVVEELVWQYAQIAVQYDAESTLASILEEVELIQRAAEHPNLTSWLDNPHDDVYESVALQTLDKYRWQLKSKNYFVVSDQTLVYSYQGAPDSEVREIKQYVLEPQAVTDRWYFEQRSNQDTLRVNIATDAHMKITKIWINQAIIRDGQFKGLVGTGMDMGLLLDRIQSSRPDALHTLFVDRHEKIQLSLESDSVEFPLRNSRKNKPYLHEVTHSTSDYQTLKTLMVKQRNGEEPSRALVQKGAGYAVVAIEFIEPLDWYKITFVDVERMMPNWAIPFLYTTLVLSSLLISLVSYLVLKRQFVRPIVYWNQRLATLANMTYSEFSSAESNVERSLILLEDELQQSRKNMEHLVSERTAALDKLATFDVLTNLLNQRGIERELQAELSRARRERYCFGLIWVEADVVTQTQGEMSTERYHQSLQRVADGLRSVIREYDLAARWGEGEFLVLVRSDDYHVLHKIAGRLKEYVNSGIGVPSEFTVINLSVGGALVSPELDQKQALAMADSALYRAKTLDDRVYIHHPQSKEITLDPTLV